MGPDRFYLVAPAASDCCSAISGSPPVLSGSSPDGRHPRDEGRRQPRRAVLVGLDHSPEPTPSGIQHRDLHSCANARILRLRSEAAEPSYGARHRRVAIGYRHRHWDNQPAIGATTAPTTRRMRIGPNRQTVWSGVLPRTNRKIRSLRSQKSNTSSSVDTITRSMTCSVLPSEVAKAVLRR